MYVYAHAYILVRWPACPLTNLPFPPSFCFPLLQYH